MPERSADWLRQAESDLRHARNACDAGDYGPNGFEQGAPVDFYTLEEARRAISQAEAIVGFCRDQIGR